MDKSSQLRGSLLALHLIKLAFGILKEVPIRISAKRETVLCRVSAEILVFHVSYRRLRKRL